VAWPRDGHKVSAEVITFVIQIKADDPKLTKPECQDGTKDRFGIKVHRRSLERALARTKEAQPEADGCGGQCRRYLRDVARRRAQPFVVRS
jgi:hypothetical protein